MTNQNRIQWKLLFAVLFVALCLSGVRQPVAQAQAAAQAPQAMPPQIMPVDPQITIGTFANGMRYYIRANQKPAKHAELRLAIKAGSILEDDDQQGMAHFVEHMAFNGTKNFPKQEIVSFLESLGMRFGADLNAYTSFDETVYQLQVPTDKPGALERAFQVLEDWAHNVTFDVAEIEKERGVVLEEWRSRRGAGARMQEKIFPVALNGSRYANRLPIGKPEIIQSGKAERLKKFYEDWYRPELMAVVAVGDFDKAAVEKIITARFGSLPKTTAPRARTEYEVPDKAGTSFVITTDKETTNTVIEVSAILPASEDGTVPVYRQKTVNRIFSGMLSARLAEMTQKSDAPFLAAFVGRSGFLGRKKDQASLTALVKEDGIERGLEAVLLEAERVARFGFTATELERQKQTVLRGYERTAAEKDTRPSASRADEYIRNFLEGESLPSAESELALHQQFLPGITLAEVNKLAKEWFPDQNRLVVVTAPQKAGLVMPDEAKLTAVIKAVPAKELKPYVDTLASATLIETPPAPGAIAKTAVKETIGVTEWELSNGVRVVLKPTTFKADEILFRATSPGGTSLASDQDFVTANAATQVISAGGLGKFSATDLRKLMAGKVAGATPFIGELEEGLNGSSARKDLETMFQLIYLRFTQPRADADAFKAMTAQMKTLLANQSASPQYSFFEAFNLARYNNHPRRRMMTAAMIDEWNLDKSLAFYRDRFADASDFTFVFVGSFDLATIKPLVERYLGALPALKRKETWKDVGVRPPTGVIEKRVEKGVEPKSQAALVFSGPFEYNAKQRVALSAMAEILGTKLLETIREELGGTYSINASPGYQKNPAPEYSVSIQFGCAPERTDDLIKRVLQEVEKLKAEGPTEKQLQVQKEKMLQSYEAGTQQNGYWLNQLTGIYQNNEDPTELLSVAEFYKKLDAEAIQQAAKKYLNTANLMKVTLFPEKK